MLERLSSECQCTCLPTLDEAAALLDSLVRNYSLVEGHQRLAWAATASSASSTGGT